MFEDCAPAQEMLKVVRRRNAAKESPSITWLQMGSFDFMKLTMDFHNRRLPVVQVNRLASLRHDELH